MVAEGGVLLDVYSLAFIEFDERALLEPGMEFELVGGGDDAAVGEEAFEFCFREVGDADGFCFSGLKEGFHGAPGFEEVGVAGLDFAIGVFWDEGGGAGEGGGPVHEVEVKVVGVEVFEGGIEGGGDVVGVVGVVPEFGGDEDLGAGDAALLDGFAYSGLGAVAMRVVSGRCRRRVSDGRRTFELCRCDGIRL